MDLSIIIVNWNSKDYLRKCLSSLMPALPELKFEIIVIDGGSFDGCREMLKTSFPHVRFIQSKENVGFAKANNEAFKISSGEILLFLNPDTKIVGEAIRELLSYMTKLPDAGVLGAKLVNTDGSVQMNCIRAFPTVINQVLESNELRRWFKKSDLWGMAPLFNESDKPVEVDALSGACMMLKRNVFEKIGFFSSEFFMYSEDIELCHKINSIKLKCYYIPTAVIVHHGGGSSTKSEISTFSSVMMLESRNRYFKKVKNREYCSLYRCSIIFAGLIRLLIITIFWPKYALSGNNLTIKSIIKKWTSKMRWALGGENWVKNY